jgi:hypothetical protein
MSLSESGIEHRHYGDTLIARRCQFAIHLPDDL